MDYLALFRQFSRFLAIGSLGFIIDAATFQILWQLGASIVVARLIAFIAALISTFLLNRSYTFEQGDLPIATQFIKYFLASSTGGAINLTTFFIIYYWLPIAVSIPLIALVSASIAGLVANFTLYSIYVFRPRASNSFDQG